MKFNLFGILPLCLSALSFTACGEADHESLLKESADSFAVNYFNWDFQGAMPYCETGSQKWLRYAASQVHQADVDLLRAMEEGATCEAIDINTLNDSTAIVRMKVSNFMAMDTIGKAARLVNEAVFPLQMKRRGEQWKVRMEGLPQSEKKSHD